MNAGSSTYRDPSVTYVGDGDDDLEGFGAQAAQGSNGEFRYGIGDVSGAQGSSSSGAQGGAYQGSHQTGYSTGGTGGSRSESGAHGARTGGGYSTYSSSSFGKSTQSNFIKKSLPFPSL